MDLTPEQSAQLERWALEDSWRRGCTCGEKPRVAVLSAEGWRVRVGVEHLEDCPLWNPRELEGLPNDTPPDSVSSVKLEDP